MILFACCFATAFEEEPEGRFSDFRFQNEYNKVEIAHCVMECWSEIKLVITNRIPASR